MNFDTKQLPADGSSIWAGMGDYLLVSPDQKHHIKLIYEFEPPHGDSVHSLFVDDRRFAGEAWGCNFAFSACSRYVVFSGMHKRLQRITIVIDVEKSCYFDLPDYIHDFKVTWPSITEVTESPYKRRYTINGNELWQQY